MILQLSLDELQTEAVHHCKCLRDFSIGQAKPKALEEVRRLLWDPFASVVSLLHKSVYTLVSGVGSLEAVLYKLQCEIDVRENVMWVLFL